MTREIDAKFQGYAPAQLEAEADRVFAVTLEQRVNPSAADLWIIAIGKNHDTDAFRQVFCHFAPRLKTYFIRRRLSAPVAEELTQEIMLAVWNKASQFEHLRCDASAWIFTIARNLMIDAIRRDKLNKGASLCEKPDSAPDPEQIFEATEREILVRRALKTLPESHAEILSLSFFDDLTHKEISTRLHQPLGTVKSRIKRAAARLRQVLGSPP